MELPEPLPPVSVSAYTALEPAYNERGKQIFFPINASVEEERLDASFLKEKAGLPAGFNVSIYCDQDFCTSKCGPCQEVELSGTGETTLCVYCEENACRIFLGKKECR
jgi:hypothetical protein